jgi:hypothetical protein
MNTPAYQIERLVTAKGKRVAASKRRCRWRFGYANPEAMEQGLSGADCRGEEHEVVMVWSLTSGKQFILADGNEVHFSKGTFTDKFECSWTTKNGHELMVIAYATPPLFHCSGVRQFDLLIDGRSYCDMPTMPQLGRTGNPSRARSTPAVRRRSQVEYLSNSNPSLSAFEASPPRRTQSLPKLALERLIPVGDLLSDSTPAVAPQDLFSTSMHSPTSVMDAFAPQPPAPPSFQDAANQMLTSYGTPDAYSEYMVPIEQALKSLVNFDFQESPQQIQTQADLPVNNNASLSEIKAQAPQKMLTKEVMRTYSFDATAVQNGLMVLYGDSQLQPPCSGMHMGATQSIYAQ